MSSRGGAGGRLFAVFAFLVCDHGPPYVVSQTAFEASFGFAGCLSFGDLGVVIGVAEAAGYADLGDGDGVQRGVQLTISGSGQSVTCPLGAGYFGRRGAGIAQAALPLDLRSATADLAVERLTGLISGRGTAGRRIGGAGGGQHHSERRHEGAEEHQGASNLSPRWAVSGGLSAPAVRRYSTESVNRSNAKSTL